MKEHSARDLALMVLKEVDQVNAYSNIALNRVLEAHRPGRMDRAFITELVYGTLRTRNTLDWVLGKYLRQPLKNQTHLMQNILRLGVYQLMYLDRVPHSAAVNEAVNQARRFGHPGAEKFVNGVLRNVSRGLGDIVFPDVRENPLKYISLKYSHPQWLVQRWLALYGPEETEALCRENNKIPPNTVRTNTLKVTRARLGEIFREEGFGVRETLFAPEGLVLEELPPLRDFKPFQEGLFVMQDESSMLAAHALGPKPGKRVLDIAAAPGGKSTHMAQLMENSGAIIAVDIHDHKLKLMEENCARLGISIIIPHLGDARNLPGEMKSSMDYVLADLPCSGLGVLGRKPDARWHKSPGGIADILPLQRELLDSAGLCLKPGGVMLYSTCTLSPEENIDMVKWFLESHQGYRLQSLEGYIPGELDLDNTIPLGYIQTLPHRHGMDGFFMARIIKQA